MKGLTFYDKQHIQKVLAQQNAVANIFNRFILSVTPHLRQWADRSSDNVWLRNQVVEKCVDRELASLQSQLLANIIDFNIDAWKRSDMKNEDFITEYIKGMAIDSVKKQGMFATNKDALSQLRKGLDARGNNISPMVWNLADQTKTQLEYYLQTGLSVGRSATQIGQDLRQVLNEPDKRFHRVKDKNGKLVMSQPMKDYHPGQGVYRSAKMNALRLTATSTNVSYRAADYERWSKQDFTLGIEIQRSANNHGPCRICDSMVGKYPKTFKFTGFHPFCICFATPIVMEPEDLADYLFTDQVPQEQVVTDIPQSAKNFVSDNKEGLQSAYWYKDNFTKDGSLQRQVIKPQSAIPTNKKQEFDFNAKTPQEAIEHIKLHIADNVSLEIKKGDLPLMNSIINQMQQRMSEFNIPKFSNVGKPASKAATASWDESENSINFNLSKLKNTSSIWKKVEAWKKKGIKYCAYESETDIARSTIDHELGHKLFWQYGMKGDAIETFGKAGVTRNGVNEVTDILGYYASTDLQEYFAESIAMYLGPGKDKLGKETSAMLERMMEKMRKKKKY